MDIKSSQPIADTAMYRRFFEASMPVIAPTYLPKLEDQKTCDIIHPSS
jgi:hypothetical protein